MSDERLATATKILLDEPNTSGNPMLWAGDIERLASATDVIVVDAETLLTIHLAGQAVHLLRVSPETGQYEVVDSTATVAAGRQNMTDLFAWDPSSQTFATSNCRIPSASIYRLVGDRILFTRELRIESDTAPGFTHGVGISPSGDRIVLVNSNGTCAIRIHDLETGRELVSFEIPGWRPKAVRFLDEHHLVVPLCDGSPTPQAAEPYNSRLVVVHVDMDTGAHTITADSYIAQAHVDAVAVDPETSRVYLSDQTNDLVRVYECGPTSLDEVEAITGIELPHGVDVRDGLLAVTSYYDSSVNVMSIGTTEFEPSSTYAPRRTETARLSLAGNRVMHEATDAIDQREIARLRQRLEKVELEREKLRVRAEERASRIDRLQDERDSLRARLASSAQSEKDSTDGRLGSLAKRLARRAMPSV